MKMIAIIKKELLQIVRDTRTLLLLIFVPAILLMLFGYVLSFDVNNIKLGVLDMDKSEQSRELVSTFTAAGYFTLVKDIKSNSELSRSVDDGSVTVAISIPNGFAKSLERGEPAQIQAIIDGSEARMATIVQGYVLAHTTAYSNKVLSGYMLRLGQKNLALPVDMNARIWYNPELKSSLFLIAGLIVFILMITTTVSTSLSVVRERERGTMEQLMVSPLNPMVVIVGKTIPYLVVASLSTIIILIVGNIAFGIEVRGSYALLALSSLLFIFAALGQGILISTVTASQQVAFLVSSLSTLLPAILLSGFIFPITSMPFAIQLVTKIVPAKYFVSLLRGVLMKGSGITTGWENLAALAALSLFMIVVSAIRLKKMKLV